MDLTVLTTAIWQQPVNCDSKWQLGLDPLDEPGKVSYPAIVRQFAASNSTLIQIAKF
jgi:hypothetical protein